MDGRAVLPGLLVASDGVPNMQPCEFARERAREW